MLDPADNLVLPFQLESSHLRGRAVRLGSALDLILHQHSYPEPVGLLLAEATVIAAALATALKYEGVFTLQAKGDGAVRLLVADVTSEGTVRAYAQFDKNRIAADAKSDKGNAALLGKGHLAFTCALTGQEDRYQGIVALEGGSLAEAVQHYFRQSEQLPSGIMAAARRDAHGRWRGGCLLLQKMPREGGINVESTTSPDAEDWTRAMIVMGSCTSEELTDPLLTTETLLYRLFHEEGVRVYEPQALQHRCRCSEGRVRCMLQALPRAEIEDLAENGVVTVTCEFCNKSYPFDGAAIEALYAETSARS